MTSTTNVNYLTDKATTTTINLNIISNTLVVKGDWFPCRHSCARLLRFLTPPYVSCETTLQTGRCRLLNITYLHVHGILISSSEFFWKWLESHGEMYKLKRPSTFQTTKLCRWEYLVGGITCIKLAEFLYTLYTDDRIRKMHPCY